MYLSFLALGSATTNVVVAVVFLLSVCENEKFLGCSIFFVVVVVFGGRLKLEANCILCAVYCKCMHLKW